MTSLFFILLLIPLYIHAVVQYSNRADPVNSSGNFGILRAGRIWIQENDNSSRFVHLDSSGMPRVWMMLTKQGNPTIDLLDKQDKHRMLLKIDDRDNSIIELLDGKESFVIRIQVASDGTPSIILRNKGQEVDLLALLKLKGG